MNLEIPDTLPPPFTSTGGFAKNISSYRNDQTAFFQNRYKYRRRYIAEFLVTPSKQRFCTHDLKIRCLHDRLIKHLKTAKVIIHITPHCLTDIQSSEVFAIVLLVKHRHLIPAVTLCFVQGKLCQTQYFICRLILKPFFHDTGRNRVKTAVFFLSDCLGYLPFNPIINCSRSYRIIGGSIHDHKLICQQTVHINALIHG